MKRLRCPKCDESILFDETLYEPGRVLVFQCPSCQKKFKVRMPEPQTPKRQEQLAYAKLVVLENSFHLKQEILLHEGANVIGRMVKGTKANAPIKTLDPSMDTTHCIIMVKPLPDGTVHFSLRDAPSNTGTFLHNQILGNREQAPLSDGDIITLGATTLIFKNLEE